MVQKKESSTHENPNTNFDMTLNIKNYIEYVRPVEPVAISVG